METESVVGLKEICVLLLAGGVGAGSVVTVQAAQKAKPVAARPKPRPVAARPAPPRPALEDCPALVAPLGSGLLPDVASSLPLGQAVEPGGSVAVLSPGLGDGLVVPPGGGSGGIILPPPPVGPSVPEPAAWAMMLSGFGLVGVALRMGRRPLSASAPALTQPARAA
jgi:hypothetical protein